VLRVLVACAVLLILFAALERSQPGGQARAMDFEAFFVAGRLALEGRLGDAYHAQSMFAAQERLLGHREFLLWTYPPHFNLFTAPLALQPRWLGYALFASASLAGFLMAVRRLAPGHLGFVCLALFPALMVCLRTGQNGVMLAALLATALALVMDGRRLAGVPIACLTIKPHYLPALGLWLLLRRQWQIIAVAAVVTALLLAAATLLFDSVWQDFRHAVGEASGHLAAGDFPMHRMTSLFAALRSMGIDAGPALAAQAALALGWLAALLHAIRSSWPQRQQLALAAMASLFLSPYAFDYDLPLLASALALLAPELTARARPAHLGLAVLLCWLAGGYGAALSPQALADPAHPPPSLAVLALLPACLWLLWLARREVGPMASAPADAA
jgi:hypothetical protein